jgi:uncharacterized protein (TIGR02145 family)
MQYFDGQQWIQMAVGLANAPFTSPSLTTNTPTSITTTTASAGGNITSDGGSSVTTRGVVWSTTTNPTVSLITKTTDGTGVGPFTSNITGLTPNTTYYVRAYATNSVGTTYGTQQTFTTTNTTFVNLPSVTIGTQIWSSKNLDVATYRNGDPIPQVTDPTQWSNLTTGAWCWYNNDSVAYAATYGRLYNWYAVNDPRGLAPQGWHVPNQAEWNILVNYIDPAGADTVCRVCGQSSTAGGAMKNTIGWNSPNFGATNSSGFSGLPGGARMLGEFYYVGDRGFWWSASASTTWAAKHWLLLSQNSFVAIDENYKNIGFSVRVVRD